MKRSYTALFVLLILCALCLAVTAPVAADGDPTTTETTVPPEILPTLTEPTETAPTVVTQPETTVTVPTVVTPETTITVPTVVTQPETTVTVPTVVTPETTVTVPTVVTQPTTTAPTQVGGGKGYIDTYCNVDGASVYFDGSYQCMIAQGVCTVGVSPTGSPISTVTVSKSGYTTWSGTLSQMPADGQHVPVYATINPISTQTTIIPGQPGTIYAQSSPSGAAIYMNGNFYGYAPLTIPSLQPGTYTMKASLSGYTSNTQIVTVYAGQTTNYYPVLQQSPNPRSTGTVSVTSSPSAALVYVDGTYMGKVPMTVTLYPGTHAFRLSLSGYNDYTANVYVTANTNQNLNAIMSPAVYGTVAITSLPGAHVTIDNVDQGKIPSSGTLTVYNVANGNRLIKVTASGYNDWLNSVYVKPNVVTSVNAVLTPVGTNPTPVPATGSLDIVSTPAGAEIYVDNLFKGYTPSTLTNIAAGQHQLLLRYTGYIDYTQTVTVTSGQTTPLAISMQAATPTPSSSPSVLIVVGGLMMAIGAGALLRRRM